MNLPLVDLRSDTVTRPNAPKRPPDRTTEVGDHVTRTALAGRIQPVEATARNLHCRCAAGLRDADQG